MKGLLTRAIDRLVAKVVIILFIAGLIIVTVLIYGDMQGEGNLTQRYYAIDNRVTDSKSGFNKRVTRIVETENGYECSFEFVDLNDSSKVSGNSYNLMGGTLINDLSEYTKMEELFSTYGGKWASKSKRMAIIWDTCMHNGFSQEFTIGLIANSLSEGNFGQLENKDFSYADLFRSSGNWPQGSRSIKTLEQWKTLINYIDTHSGKDRTWFGIGCIQWSSQGRQNGLIEVYRKYLEIAINDLSDDDQAGVEEYLAMAEMEHMVNEIKGKYNDDIMNKLGKHTGLVPNTAADYAAAICDGYEIPSASCAMQASYIADGNTDKMFKTFLTYRGNRDITTLSSILIDSHGYKDNSGWACGKRAAIAEFLTEIINTAVINDETQYPEPSITSEGGSNK